MARNTICFIPRRLDWLLVAAGLLFFFSCHKNGAKEGVVVRGDRHLGLHLSAAQNGDYPAAYAQGRTAGMDCVPLTLQWSAMEQNGQYDPGGLLGALNGFYSGLPVSLSLCVSPFAASHRDVPADLINTAFDDPVMISRFNRLLDTVHSRLGAASVRYLLIGNEADLYLTEHAAEWAAYGRFCRAVRWHARKLWGPELKTAAETTLGSAIGEQHAQVKSLQDSMDLLCVTYYPLGAEFFMKPSSQAVADFGSLFTLYPSRPVMFQECGYATGAACGGSDTAQVNFIKGIFNLWDQRATQISYVAFLWLNDLSQEEAARVTQDYGLAGTAAEKAFTEYIRTLGLCNEQGVPKAGFTALQQEALTRGWTN